MLDLRAVLDRPDELSARLGRRGPAALASLAGIAPLGEERRTLIALGDQARERRNLANEQMKRADKQSPEFAVKRDELRALGEEIKKIEERTREIERRVEDLLLGVPNLPHPSVPDGVGEEENVVVRTWGDKPAFDFSPQEHTEIGERLGLFDFERAAKLSGSRFAVLRGGAPRLERALIDFMLDLHTREHGYRELWVPALVKREALVGTGQLPKFADDLFAVVGDDLYLIPTAEVPLTNLHAGEILDGAALPLAYTAYTPCFRSEAGSHGKDVKGILRQRQFDKVEMVRFARAEDSYAQLEILTGHAEAVLQALGLHYRVVALSAGDLGFAPAKTYDVEVWLPGQNKYREISSCSNCEDFQARRAKIRYRPGPQDKPRFAHTLNGSGLAIGRTMIAILEQFQRKDGTVRLPEILGMGKVLTA